jgi:hypothetical protein
MREALSLENIRYELGRTWLIVLFASAYTISQITIIIILRPIADAMITLQTTGFSAGDYIAVFESWNRSDGMAAFRAHFIFDNVHWIWYAGLFTTFLCRLFERHAVPGSYNWILLLPLASGLLDRYENHIQHVFLSASDFSTIVDPLPLFSTLASDAKWLLALTYVILSAVLLLRKRR